MDLWPMLEGVMDCGNECGGMGLGPPPKFLIPPPPRPPFLQPLNQCRDEPSADNDMCDAISMLDVNFLTESTLQSSALIALFSIILILIIAISSLFIWNLAQNCSCKRARARAVVSETYQCSCDQPYTRSILPLTNQCSCQRSNSSWSSTYYRPCTCQHCARANLALAYWSPKSLQQWQYTIE